MNKKFKKVPILDVLKTPSKNGFYELITGSFWAVTDDDCILLFGKGESRQCNTSKKIAECMIKGENYPAKEVIFLDKVWLPHDCSGYVDHSYADGGSIFNNGRG